jgi:hypothetical protein
MKRIFLVAVGIALAGGIAGAPAVAGLAGNPSFSHEIPVPAPSNTKQPVFLDHGGATRHVEPGDDRGHAASTPSASTPAAPHAVPADDHGGRTPHAEPSGDHHGGGTSGGKSGGTGGKSGRG